MTNVSIVSRTFAFIRLGRLQFLAGGVLLHALGVSMALYSGATLDITALVWGQIAITATQLMTHYANDYFDLEADQANQTPTRWSGGSRVLVDGALPAQTALVAALVLAAIALGANSVLNIFVHPSLATFVLLAVSQCAAWFYSAPPLRLHSRGLGELMAAIVVAGLTPITGYMLQRGQLDLLPVLAVTPLVALQFAMLLSIEFPDAEGDRQVGKGTLVVRLGMRHGIMLYTLAVCSAFVSLPLLVRAGLPGGVGLAVAALLPVAVGLLWQAVRGDWCNPLRWGSFAFHTVLLLMGATAAQVLAFLLLIGLR
ncbi:MAG TPA: prenyltransferase [Candidatus Limnocylindrales bacterium]|nr:prenyltransferase [Candidatus Limnocylindrales bacterium]